MLVVVDVLVVVGVPEDVRTRVPQHDVAFVVHVERVVHFHTFFLRVAAAPVHTLVTAQRVAELLLQRVYLGVRPDLRVEGRRVLDLDVYFYLRLLLRVLVDRHVLLLVLVHYLLLDHLFLLQQRVLLLQFRFRRQSPLFLRV